VVEVLLPADGVAFAVAYLKAQYAAHGETALVGSKVRDPRPPKFTKVRLMGGYDADAARYAPMLLFECWAPDDLSAWNLGQLTFGLVDALPDLNSGCTRVVGVGGLVEQPDPDTNTPRYVFTSQIYLRKTVLV
jgi:hypothetical protein